MEPGIATATGFVVILFITGVITGAFASKVAEEKGYGSFTWFILGFFFSIIALIAAAGLPDKEARLQMQTGTKK
jgi:uncharacterized membrane protein YeaQ/YmgE (transglycosylase-associated protein family)